MTNPSKERGTRGETRVLRHMYKRLGDERLRRQALSGARDRGDIGGIFAHGWQGVAEVKNLREEPGPKLLRVWMGQAVAERENAGAGFAVLVVLRPGRAVGRAYAYVTIRDLARICLGLESHREDHDERWVCMTLDECCDLIGGEGVE